MLNRKLLLIIATIFLVATFPAEGRTRMRANHSATYYANSLVGKKMTNGKRYHHGLAIAAHPSKKIGTRLQVCIVKNGKCVVVRVADRCNCSIDLSKGAFRQIASTKQGRVPVRVKRI